MIVAHFTATPYLRVAFAETTDEKQERILTIDEAIEKAVASNSFFIAAEKQDEISKSLLRQARQNPSPELKIGVDDYAGSGPYKKTSSMKSVKYGKLVDIIIGMVYDYLPFAILPLYNQMLKMDKNQIEAARDLGANSVQTFVKNILPQSIPGIISACTMTFMPTMSSYVISDTLSEGKISNIRYDNY